ncbi:MAG: DDE-type integrase/transposase/recombinase [Nitrospira sp.]|nr:DDE-type integrase/transposase/recombinase [Nitrospira sp.]
MGGRRTLDREREQLENVCKKPTEFGIQPITRRIVPNRQPSVGLLHSDRGSQYAATTYQQVLITHGMTPSMSRRGNCWANACVESFFGTLKRELIYHRQYRTRHEATQDIFEYIEVFYKKSRRHSTLGYDSPAEYEARTAVA